MIYGNRRICTVFERNGEEWKIHMNLINIKKDYQCTIYASYLGYVTQAIGNNFTPLLFVLFQKQFGIPLSEITLLVMLNFLTQLVVDLLATKYVDRIGYRVCVVAAHICSAVGLVGLAVFPRIMPDAYPGLVMAIMFCAVGGGLIEVLVSPIVEACPTDNKSAVMSLLHSFYCWGTVAVVLLSTIFMSAFGSGKWYVLACLWALVPALNALLFTQVPLATLTEGDEGMSLKEMFSNKLFWLFLILMVTAGASEQGMSQWASAFAESGLKVSKTIGDLAGPCMFAVMMGISRVFYAKFSEKVNLVSYLAVSGVLCVSSYLIAAFSSSSVIALLGCGMCGLSVGIMWPGVFSIASAGFPKGGTAMFALLALAGDAGCSAGPAVVGLVADLFGGDLKTGLAGAMVFPLVLVVCTTVYKMHKR